MVPERVTAPKVIPAVPLVTLGPPLTVKVWPPMPNVPKVNVSPAPAAVRSDVTVEFALTVVLLPKLRFVAAAFANCSVPPPSATGPCPRPGCWWSRGGCRR